MSTNRIHPKFTNTTSFKENVSLPIPNKDSKIISLNTVHRKLKALENGSHSNQKNAPQSSSMPPTESTEAEYNFENTVCGKNSNGI